MAKDKEMIERIADQFQAHFTHFGFKKTSVDDVARELKISKKTIYEFFDSKEKVFYHVVSRIAGAIRRRMEGQLKEFPTYSEELSTLIGMIFAESRKWLKQNNAFEFKYKYEIASLAFRDAFTGLLQNLVESGIAAGEFAAAPVELRVNFIQGIINESMKLLSVNPDLPVEEEVMKTVQKILQ